MGYDEHLFVRRNGSTDVEEVYYNNKDIVKDFLYDNLPPDIRSKLSEQCEYIKIPFWLIDKLREFAYAKCQCDQNKLLNIYYVESFGSTKDTEFYFGELTSEIASCISLLCCIGDICDEYDKLHDELLFYWD